MKKCTLILILLFFCIIGHTQYQKTLIEGSTWYLYYSFESSWNEKYSLSGDTIINNHNYKKLNLHDEDTDKNLGYYCLLREDTVKQEIYIYSGEKEYLNYKFKLAVGDTFPRLIYNQHLIVKNITTLEEYIKNNDLPALYRVNDTLKTIVYNQMKDRKVIYLGTNEDNVHDIWIEGIGSILGICHEWERSFKLLCYEDTTGYILHLSQNSKCYGPILNVRKRTSPKKNILFPNPTQGIFTIKDIFFNKAQIFNITGKLLLSTTNKEIDIGHLPKGIYILKLQESNNIITQKIIKQ